MLTLFKYLYFKMKKYILKRYSFNVITQILDEKIIHNITIKDYYAPRIIVPNI